MLYRVLLYGLGFNGEDILDYDDPTLILLSPQAEIELDVSGSFEFTVPPNHQLYDAFSADSIMQLTIEVWEDSIMHWFGRPIEFHLDFYKNKKINCEGGLAFFNDSVIRTEEWENTALSTIFQSVIAEHNSMVPSNRQFTVGNFTVKDEIVYRKFNYESTFDVLKSKFLDAVDGHFFVRRENGVNYIDFLKDMPYTCNQQVEFAQNLLNFTYNFDGKDFATCVIPLGANDQDGEPINIKDVNNNSDILVGSAATNYGNIVKVQQYSDITDPNELVTEGRTFLSNLQYNAFLIECSAVDLHSKDSTKNQFVVGQKVSCVSVPHWINLELPISKLILYLDSAAKQITLGRIPKKTLSRFYKNEVDQGGGGESSIGEDEIPNGWQIIPPDTDGGTPTMKRIPSNIVIHAAPLQIHYNQNDTIDFTGLKIRILTPALDGNGLETYMDSNYPTGIISYPSNELILPVTRVTQKTPQIRVPVQWRCPYTGQLMVNYFNITNDTAAALAGNLPEYIQVVSTGLESVKHKEGQFINYAGLKVKAYTSNGEEWDVDGYPNGLIPISELEILPRRLDAAAMETVDGNEYRSELDTSPFVQPIITCEELIGRGTSISTTNRKIGWRAGNGAKIVALMNSRGQFSSFFYASPADGTCQSFGWTNIGEEPVWTNNGAGKEYSYTYNGKTVYLSSSLSAYDTIPISGEANRSGDTYTYAVRQKVAWTVIYGEVVSGTKLISVNWKRPDGVTLTTTFEIKVGLDIDTPGNGGR